MHLSIRTAPLMTALIFYGIACGSLRADAISNSYDDYGHAANNGPYCAATSFANSFAFLQNKYPGIYGNSLTNNTANPTDARDAIVNSQTGTNNGDGSPPSSFQTIWESKVDYLEKKAPGKTTYEAQQIKDISIAGWERKDVIEQVIPTTGFLFTELKKGEDVEIGFTGIPTKEGDEIKNNGSHMVTLTGIDTTNKTLTYLDPNNPTKDNSGNHPGLFTANYTINGDGYIDFKWDNKNNDPVDHVTIFQAYAESPVPEPSSLALLGLGGIGLAFGAYRHRRTESAV